MAEMKDPTGRGARVDSPPRCRRGGRTDNAPMHLKAGPDFDFRSAVCSHGFFMLAPNRWDPVGGVLCTAVALDDDRAVGVDLRAAGSGRVRMDLAGRHRAASAAAARRAVIRMLRLGEDLSGFHARCRASTTHRAAARQRFGRLLRGASLFEDVVKVLCTCNTAWSRTVVMVGHLVQRWGVPAEGTDRRAFPTPRRLAEASEADLRAAGLGYRAGWILRLARAVAEGRVDLAAFERSPAATTDLMYDLRRIRGVGPYAAAHLAMLLGRYDCLAWDSEMRRLLEHRAPHRRWTPAAAMSEYRAWHPYQFLAYWYDLWRGYADVHGAPHLWDPAVLAGGITRRGRGGTDGRRQGSRAAP